MARGPHVEPRLLCGRAPSRALEEGTCLVLDRERAEPHGLQEPQAHGGRGRANDGLDAQRRLGRVRHDDDRRHRVHLDGRQGGARPREGREALDPKARDRRAAHGPRGLRQGRSLLWHEAPPRRRRRGFPGRARGDARAHRSKHRARRGVGASISARRRRSHRGDRGHRAGEVDPFPRGRLCRGLLAAVGRGARLPRPDL